MVKKENLMREEKRERERKDGRKEKRGGGMSKRAFSRVECVCVCVWRLKCEKI